MADKRLELAYEAAKSTLSQQNETLGGIRNRATSMLAAAALAVSFTAGIGLISGGADHGRDYPVWVSVALLVVLTCMSSAILLIQWPAKNFHFGPSAATILERREAGDDEDAVRLKVTNALIEANHTNRGMIRRRQNALRTAVVFLWLEIILIIIAIIIT